MSYCEIIVFTGDKPAGGIEFRNAWGGAARIWNSLFDKYIKDQNIPYHSWMNEKEQRKLWDLANDERLQMFERIVHCSTFDRAYISRNHFKQFAADLRAFDSAYPADQKYINHLPAWADAIEKLDFDAIGFYGTSVGENLWLKWNKEKEEDDPVPLSKGFEIYDALAPKEGAKP